jgi:hypothetical protein
MNKYEQARSPWFGVSKSNDLNINKSNNELQNNDRNKEDTLNYTTYIKNLKNVAII